jgi:DNA-binding NarL/FixJ family response regulator
MTGSTNSDEKRQVTVLIVDDTNHVRAMLVDMLQLDGFEVVGEAASGREAMDMATENDPDVIVMDYKMPGMDGLSAARHIRARRPDQAIILYTAYLDTLLEAEAKKAGVALCVGKVEGLTQLERHINDLYRHDTSTRR